MPWRTAAVPVYPVVLAFTFVFAAFLDADVNLHAAVQPILLVVVVTVLGTVVLSLALGPLRGGLVSGVLVLLARSGNLQHAALALLLVALIAAAFVLVRRIRPTSQAVRRPTSLLNTLSAILLVTTVVTAAANGSLGRVDLRQGAPVSALDEGVPGADAPPDIYIVLLDGYPRHDTLARLFDDDNRDFLDGLEGMGFDVAELARSNYMYTGPTLASMHHMQYVHDITDLGEVNVPFGVSLRAAINDNPVWTTLRERGYDVVAVKPPWEHEAMRSADVFCGESVNDFELFLVRTTLAGAALQAVNPTLDADQHRASVEEALDCFDQLTAATSSPKLVFVHVGGPHLPIAFDESGAPADPDLFGHTRQDVDVSDEAFASGYVAQLQYLNTRVLASLDELVARPDQPVVLVMSDHGSESRLNWADASESDLAERLSILFAARTPGHESLFPCDMTPISIFPTLLSTYFGDDIAVPPARHFASDVEDKLDFEEVPDPDGSTACGP
jgi:hypothetical protein